MPIGDPGGGNFRYTTEGLPEAVFMATVPCRNIDGALSFYKGLLGMDVLYRKEGEAAVRRNNATLLLKVSDAAGIDTGIFLGVENPYDLHRRLVDEGVVFVKDPTRAPMGVFTSFRDSDGNIIHAIEMKAEIRP
ncbi:MAG: VOC family protein [Candidatus Methanoplasma sp.]|jgi:catechol 2,3-dioxygenase-like lactoylglutathione lyase family enzyme|nr:VOC family protein [Candidatus Methanoplasma sp.]